MTKYICVRCGDNKEIDDDFNYVVAVSCKNCGGYYTPDTREQEEE